MLVDLGIGVESDDPVGIGSRARQIEEIGFDGLWCAETGHDPFLPLALAAQQTERITLGTGIAVAFARNPMTTAIVGNDLQMFSKGRFILGLGTQIKPHITNRYSMIWTNPAERMREFVLALRAIWTAWNERSKLDFRGSFYTHTLMTPTFSPDPNPYGVPKIFVAAVGRLMTRAAGEVADGMLVHGFTTEKYMREVTLPELRRGLAKAKRDLTGFELSFPALFATGATDAQMELAKQKVRSRIAFYGSTPAYRPVLELHGWGDLQSELNQLSKTGEWTTMAQLISDDIMDAFAVVSPIDDVGEIMLARYGDLVTRITLHPYEMEPGDLLRLLSSFRDCS